MATQTPPTGYSITTSSSSSSSSKTHIHNLPRQQHHHSHPPHVFLSSSAAALPQPHRLSHDFRGQRSTRFVSKLHFNRPKLSSPAPSRHSSAAEEALNLALNLPTDCHDDQDPSFETLLLSLAPRLAAPDDYSYLLRELGNRGHLPRALRCFRFAIAHASSAAHQGKLVSAAISVLGRLGRVDLARSLFDSALASGYGNTVYAYSALISAYARSGRARDAIRLFNSMKAAGLTPNLVTYNAVIDACGKGGVDFRRTLSFFNEMVDSGVSPDRITFNSLLAVCSRGGLWEEARDLFDQMGRDGVDTDLFTYNTLLDAVCKGGQMDLSLDILSEMSERRLVPNVVTYSTLIDGFAKAGRLDEALNLFRQMKEAGIKLDRVSYNTLVSIYAKLGRFGEALGICMEMESAGIRKDVVTYNALISGYGKKDNYGAVSYLFEEMKADGCPPNVLTYSTLIDCYAKMGRRKEAMAAFEEFRKQGMKADVVLYSAFIDALCKIGMVQTAVSLLDEMTMEGIKPNVVTCNSIIDAFCRSDASGVPIRGVDGDEISGSPAEVKGKAVMIGGDNNHVMNIFEKQLIVADNDKSALVVVEDVKIKTQDVMYILSMFHKMQELDIKPNVVTFSSILSACSRCNSFEDASMLLENLRLFDNEVYGVTHGLLMGCGEKIWLQAQSLFDAMKCMDSSTASAFYNALTDVLWHFGQRRGAQLVVLEGKRRQVWENLLCNESYLDLHLMSLGAAQAMIHAWLLGIRSVVFKGQELPKLVSILTGWGKHSKVPGDSSLRRAVDALLTGIGAPFHVAQSNVGRLVSAGPVVAAWLRESGTLKVLVLHDRTDLAKNYQAPPELLMATLS